MEGKPVQIGRETYVVPDINLDAAEEILARIESMKTGGWSPMKVAEVVACALRENYPEITGRDLAPNIKLRHSAEVMTAVLAAAGLEKGEGSAGEAPSPSA